MLRKFVPVIAIVVLIASTGIAIAAGTPTWWDDSGAPGWQQKVTEGEASNTGAQTQLITIIFDVPNNCPENATSKDVWEQISWTVNSGTATLSSDVRTIAWGTDACPASTSVPYNDLDSGNMVSKGAFDATPDYVDGWERSRTIASSSDGWSPKCERIFTSFQVEPSSSLNYRLEVQSVCNVPTAVGLRNLSAKASSATPLVGLVGVLALAPVALIVKRRR
jgi:hypothetical protein